MRFKCVNVFSQCVRTRPHWHRSLNACECFNKYLLILAYDNDLSIRFEANLLFKRIGSITYALLSLSDMNIYTALFSLMVQIQNRH